jgi:rare lipoprotein A (peptidoglycan hydrolase)
MATYAFPLGSIVELTYISKGGTKRSVVCEVTDRGPSKALRDKGRLFDLSHTAFRILENPKVGVIHVTAVRIK